MPQYGTWVSYGGDARIWLAIGLLAVAGGATLAGIRLPLPVRGTRPGLRDRGAAGWYVLPPPRCPCAAVVPQPPGVRQRPICAEDPAHAEDPGSPGCPNPPYKP